jgi:hypothetical protein
VLRVSAISEAAGVPASTLVCEGFLRQAKATSVGLGLPGMPVALVPSHPDALSLDELHRNTLEITTEQVIANLMRGSTLDALRDEPGEREIVFRGGFEAVNEHFCAQEWSDGLPIVPPTLERIERFLRFTERKPGEVLGVMLPDNRAATVWSVAVNGVMAGCRPEYMPILVALAEAMADPRYGVEHSGNTPGSETLIVLNGPIIGQLGFNCTQGVLRDGFRPNTSVGRFWRLYLRNVAGFLPHKTDKGTYGNTFRVVCAENEDAVARIGWTPTSVDMGFAAGDNTVTISRMSGGNVIASISGSTPEAILDNIAFSLANQYTWQLTFTLGSAYGTLRPMVLLSPILAETIAKAGWSKRDVQNYLFERARVPAREVERNLRDWMNKPTWNLAEEAKAGRIPAVFHASDDPERRVPHVFKPEDYMVVVTGDPLRTNAYVFAQNGRLGFPTAKRIALPRAWDAMRAAAPSV